MRRGIARPAVAVLPQSLAQLVHPSDTWQHMRWSWPHLRARLAKEQTIAVSLVLAYVLTGRLGLALGYTHHAVSLVWPPSGIALGAFIVLGYRMWPAVFAGSTLLYATTVGVVPAALAMAAGNTLEGLLTAYLINRFAGGRNALQSPENTFRFAALIALASTTISATCGAATLAMTGLAAWSDYGMIWMNLSLGNLAGSPAVRADDYAVDAERHALAAEPRGGSGRGAGLGLRRRSHRLLRLPERSARLSARVPVRAGAALVGVPARPARDGDRDYRADGPRRSSDRSAATGSSSATRRPGHSSWS